MRLSALSPAMGLLGLMLVIQPVAPARAALGAKAASVEADRAHFRARIARHDVPNYSIQDLTLDNGTVAREFTLDNGTVFAVSWNGPARPDLKQLFGDYYSRFQADNATNGHRRRKPLASSHADFIVQSGGHSGAFFGYALLPNLIPVGFSVQDLQN